MKQPKQQIIRICKEDGHEEVIDRARIERIVRTNFRHPDKALADFDEGKRISSPFAFYELREVKEKAKTA